MVGLATFVSEEKVLGRRVQFHRDTVGFFFAVPGRGRLFADAGRFDTRQGALFAAMALVYSLELRVVLGQKEGLAMDEKVDLGPVAEASAEGGVFRPPAGPDAPPAR